MGLKLRNHTLAAVVLCLGLAGSVFAAPKLRLTTAAVGPVTVATGTGGPSQIVEAWNAGDGDFNLTAAASVPWLAPSVGAPATCTNRPGLCIPIRIELPVSSLSKGVHTGLVILSDANALDAPQTVSVTVQVGGAVPDKIDFTVTPGGTQEYVIRAANALNIGTSTESGGAWLSVPADGLGSFRFDYNYRVVANAAGLAEGNYTGRLNVSGSRLSEENKQPPVTLRVTSGPILQTPDRIFLRLAEGSAPYVCGVEMVNRGGGDLMVSEASVTTDSGGDWLSAETYADGRLVRIKATPAGLAKGRYKGTLQIVSSAGNSPSSVSVILDVVAAGPPFLQYLSLADVVTGDATAALAPGMLARVRGEQLTMLDAAATEAPPYADNLAGAQVYFNGVPAAILAVDTGSILLQVPYGIDPGEAQVQSVRDGQPGNVIAVNVAARAPHIELRTLSVQAGDTVTISAVGLGLTEPRVDTGAPPPADPPAVVNDTVTVIFGASLFNPGVAVPATLAALEPGVPGRYIVQVPVPVEAPRGDAVSLLVTVGDAVSNKLTIAIR